MKPKFYLTQEKEMLIMNVKPIHKLRENKRYDCTKVVDFVHERRRMCDAHSRGCVDCPLDKHCGHIISYIDNVITLDSNTTKLILSTVQKWSDAHPEKTEIERPVLTENDIAVLKALRIMGLHWIAKDNNATRPYAYDKKPEKYHGNGIWDVYGESYCVNYDFPFLSWEDEEPTNIDWLLGGNDNE